MKQILEFWRKYKWWLFLLLILGAVTYSLLHKKSRGEVQSNVSPSPSIIPTSAPTGNGFEPSPSPAFTPESSPSPSLNGTSINNDQHLLFADYDPTNQAFYYFSLDDSTLRRFNTTDNKTEVIGQLSPFVESIAWSPNHQKILMEMTNETGNAIDNPLYQDGFDYGARIVALFDLQTQTIKPLNDNITAFSFVSDSQIVYQYQDGRYNNLSIAKPDGSSWRNIASLSEDVDLQRAGQTVLVYLKSKQQVRRYDANGKLLESLTLPRNTTFTQTRWTDQGLVLLAWQTTTNDELKIDLIKGNNRNSVATLPKKPDDLTILWDNRKGDIYSASFDGLEKLSASATP